jgi:hypothetical protein
LLSIDRDLMRVQRDAQQLEVEIAVDAPEPLLRFQHPGGCPALGLEIRIFTG